MEQFLNEKITEAKREIDRLTHVCQTKPFDSFEESNRRKYRGTINR